MDRWNYWTERTDWTAGLTLSPLVHRSNQSISSRSPLVQQSMVQGSHFNRATGTGGLAALRGGYSCVASQSSVQQVRQPTRPRVLGFSSQSMTPSD